MILYDYYRSSASYRVRIAIHYKQLDCCFEQVNLVDGSQSGPEFTDKNPQGLVPLLDDGGVLINQSQAIIEYLDEKYPDNPLVFGTAAEKASIRAFTSEIACDIHPLNNLRVLKYLKSDLEVTDQQKNDWYFEWLEKGFTSLERRAVAGPFCLGDRLSLADCFLIPQMYNAYRFNFSMEKFPKLVSIYNHCLNQEYFIKASPEERLKEIENDQGAERGN